MNIKLENIFLFLVVVTDFTVFSLDTKCPPLRLVNGRSRYRWRGRSVRFNCMKGYQLVGVKYATCMNGKWDTEVPICVKYGCHAPSTSHVNGQFIESYRGAVVKIVCNPGYTLVGPPSVYCNGIRWNETFPVCQVKNSNPALSCDFETPDLCGWSQDPMHDFDWKRRNGSTPSGDAGTGPTFDHTRGSNSTGYYMYMESSSPRMENDTARLYSPVYPPHYSHGTCFQFWYHMYGATTGFLKVYVKPEEAELISLIPSFWINGEQGKSWMQSFFTIETVETPFQIVIEGVRGSGAVGDTAFDDVKLTTAEECRILQEMTSSTEFYSSVNPDEDAIDSFSCKNRCSQEKPKGTTAAPTPDNDRCNCYETCDRDGTCCSDYFDVCSSFPLTTSSPADTDKSSWSSSPVTSSTAPTPEIEQEPPTLPKLPPVGHFNNESNEIDATKPLERIPPAMAPDRTLNKIPRGEFPTTRRTTPTKTTKTTPPSRPENPNAKSETEGTTKPGQRKVAKVIDKKLAKPAENKTKANETTKEIRPKVEAKPETTKSTTVTSSVSTTNPRGFRNPRPNNIQFQKTILEKPSSNPTNDFRSNEGKPKEVTGKEPPQAIKIDKNDENTGRTVRGIIEVGSAAVAILVIIILGISWYKRREYKKAERESMVEDSDSIVCKMDSSTIGSESYSMVCIRPGGLQQAL